MAGVVSVAADSGRPSGARRDAGIIAVVGTAHGTSHFFHLILPTMFPWLKTAFGLSFSELGLLMTVFFAVSGVGQALSGFLVDRVGALPVLLAGIACFALASAGLALSTSYAMLLAFAALAGAGNAPLHPVDYSILNARVTPMRLGHAYAVHGIAGSLGWAAAPILMVGVAEWLDWRVAYVSAALLAVLVWLLVWRFREPLSGVHRKAATRGGDVAAEHALAFLRLPAVWLSFVFFFTSAVAFGGVQSFGPQAAGTLHAMTVPQIAVCLTAFMLASAGGMLAGGFLVRDPARSARVFALGQAGAALVALAIGFSPAPAWSVPLLFALMGFGSGIAAPSRDLIIKQATPPGATGRVYGTVYSGLDVGLALAPAVFGLMMDAQRPALVWLGIAIFQALLVASALNLDRLTARRQATQAG